MLLSKQKEINALLLEWLPSSLPNTIGWFDFTDNSTISVIGNSITEIDNKIDSTVTCDQTNGRYRPIINSQSLNGVFGATFNGTFMDIHNLPQSGPMNFFMGARHTTTGSVSLLGTVGQTYLPAGQIGSTSTSIKLVEGLSNPLNSLVLFDDEITESAVTRDDISTKLSSSNMVSILLPDSVPYDPLRLGLRSTSWALRGPLTRLVIVQGVMSALDILNMRNYFKKEDNW